MVNTRPQWLPLRRLIECVHWALTSENPPVTRRIATDGDYLNCDYAKFGGYLDKTVVGIPLLPA